MNATKAVCGHNVWAVGAPGSKARHEVENSACQHCQREADEMGLKFVGDKGEYAAHMVPTFGFFSDAGDGRMLAYWFRAGNAEFFFERIVTGFLKGRNKEEDEALLKWILDAPVGEVYGYRDGWVVRFSGYNHVWKFIRTII